LFSEAHHLERLTYVKRSRLAVGADAVVIENAIGNVRVLLNLAQHNAGADGVRRTGRNEHGVARAHSDAFEAIFYGTVGESAAKRFGRHSWAEADEQLGPLTRRHHVPHLRLAHTPGGSFMLFGIRIVGVYLHGKLILREEELDQQRDPRKPANPRPGPFLRKSRPNFTKCAPSEFPVREAALVAGEPSLANRLRLASSLRE
jgi:hypothetical protein